jgi:hypothetical protein
MDVKAKEIFIRDLTREELSQLKRSDLVELVSLHQQRAAILLSLLQSSLSLAEQLVEKIFAVSRRLFIALDLLFHKSLKSPVAKKIKPKPNRKPPSQGKKIPSERHPYLEIVEQEVREQSAPVCSCGESMIESKMRHTTEKVEVIPKQYYIARYQQVVYRCNCCKQGIATAKPVPQIIPGSCYGDSFVKDVVLSKACDLIPIARYVAIAARQGMENIALSALYQFPRHLAIYLKPSIDRLALELKSALILGADETRQRMLEGSPQKNWYLWTFNFENGILFFVNPSRAGSVASNFLKECACQILVTDAYSGYSKAIKHVNEFRAKKFGENSYIPLVSAYCNAHARNNFCATSIKDSKPAKRMVWIYKIIFHHYPEYRHGEGDNFDKAKAILERAFKLLKKLAESELQRHSKKSALYDSLGYFIKYYPELTLFLQNRDIPMHNMRSEQSLRNPVQGRKIWYGSHSVEAAQDLTLIMSLVESCKLLKVNPRAYVDDAVERVHKGLPALSPAEYKALANSS